jgi:hypothetical protein
MSSDLIYWLLRGMPEISACEALQLVVQRSSLPEPYAVA